MGRFLFGLTISAVALWWAFRATDWDAFAVAVQGTHPGLLLLSVLLLLASVPVRGQRWGIFLRPFKKIPVKTTSEATLIGYFGNNILPFRMGELVRAYFLGKRAGLAVSKVIGTIILERVLDILVILLLVIMIPLFANIPEQLQGSASFAVALGLALIAVTIWASRGESLAWVPAKLRDIAENIRRGFASVRSRQSMAAIFAGTLIIWALYLASLHAGLAALGLELSRTEVYALFVATTVVVAIPSAPGFVGTYHAMVIFMLVNVMGYETGQAQAAAVILHAIGYIPYTVIGAGIYLRSHMKIRAALEAAHVAGEKP